MRHPGGRELKPDPLAGSYAIEEMTNQLERLAEEYISKIDGMGGMLAAIEGGYVQREIQEAAYEYQRAVEKQDAIVVGVNRFRTDEEDPIPILVVDENIERTQVERVRAVRERRDPKAAASALASLEGAARGTENLMPRILECVDAHVTVGEIAHRLRTVWGEYREAVTL